MYLKNNCDFKAKGYQERTGKGFGQGREIKVVLLMRVNAAHDGTSSPEMYQQKVDLRGIVNVLAARLVVDEKVAGVCGCHVGGVARRDTAADAAGCCQGEIRRRAE